MYNMMELILILETENDREHHQFNSTNGLELYLQTIDLCEYSYKNILFLIDGEMNLGITKLYYERYLSHCHQAGKHISGTTGVDIVSQYPASLIDAYIPTGEVSGTTSVDIVSLYPASLIDAYIPTGES
jgi:hypothetical protein